MARALQFSVVSLALLATCGLALISMYIYDGSGESMWAIHPVSLLHIGPLTAMMQERAVHEYSDIGASPRDIGERYSGELHARRKARGSRTQVDRNKEIEQAEKAVSTVRNAISSIPQRNIHSLHESQVSIESRLLKEYDAENQQVKTLASRDADKERAANVGAGKVLKSYSSILDSALSAYEGMSQNIEKHIHENFKEKQAASQAAAARKRRAPKQQEWDQLPDFVRKARSELMRASYVRQRQPPSPGQTKSTRFDVLAHERFQRQARSDRGEMTGITERRRSRRSPRQTRGGKALSIWRTIPPGSDTQSLIQTAVSNALAKAFMSPSAQQTVAVAAPLNRAYANEMQSGTQWTDYLAQARTDRLGASSSPLSSQPPVGRTEGQAAREAAPVYKVTFSNGIPSSPALTAKVGEAVASEPRSFEAQSALAGREEGGQPAARFESLTGNVGDAGGASHAKPRFVSEMEEMEEHLKQQVDTIFGPDPSGPISEPKKRRQRAAADAATARTEPVDHGTETSKDVTAHPEKVESKQKEAAERAEEQKLQAVVKRLKEAERLQKLQQQVTFLRHQREKIRSLEGNVASLRTQLVRKEAQEIEEQRIARMIMAAKKRRIQTLAETNGTTSKVSSKQEGEKANTTEGRKVRICDGFGCFFETLPSPPPPPPPVSPADEVKQALNGDANLWSLLIPWDGAWESEVHLNENGTITAEHDDPRGRLLPHNPYQDEARYPDGYHRSEPRAGISNFVAPHLFDDAIVPAQAGFNAGLGRHVRVQQASDWERNWCGELGCVDAIPEPLSTTSENSNATSGMNATSQ